MNISIKKKDNKKIAFIVDTSIIMKKNQYKNNKNVFLLPFNIIEKSSLQEWKDDININDQNYFINLLSNGSELKSSQPNKSEFVALVNKIIEKKYNKIVIYLIHKAFSGTYKNVSLWTSEFYDEIKNNILILHSKNFLLESCNDFLNLVNFANKNQNLNEIQIYFDSIKARKLKVAIIININQLIKGGRFEMTKKLEKVFFKKGFIFAFVQKSALNVPILFIISRSILKIFVKFLKLKNKNKYKNYCKILNFYYATISDEDYKKYIEYLKNIYPDYEINFIQWPNIFSIIFGLQYVIEIPETDEVKCKSFRSINNY